MPNYSPEHALLKTLYPFTATNPMTGNDLMNTAREFLPADDLRTWRLFEALDLLCKEGLISGDPHHLDTSFFITAKGRQQLQDEQNKAALVASAESKTTNNITINNSSGFNVGDHNTLNLSQGINFEDAHRLVDSLEMSNRETMHEVLETLRDCIENSKPLPKGKFAKWAECLQSCTQFINLIGQIVTGQFTN